MRRAGSAESVSITSISESRSYDDPVPSHPLLVSVKEAAAITGLPESLIRKSFIDERKRPPNIPSPPPHKRIGRSVYIIRDGLARWVSRIGEDPAETNDGQPRRGRPTAVQRRAKQPDKDIM